MPYLILQLIDNTLKSFDFLNFAIWIVKAHVLYQRSTMNLR
jgi:hypothetical protein